MGCTRPGVSIAASHFQPRCPHCALESLCSGFALSDKHARFNRYVALKICVSETANSSEISILQRISSVPNDTHPGQQHIVQLRDSFHLEGPNGRHQCVALELTGPSISEFVNHWRAPQSLLPAQAAKIIARQVCEALDFLAGLGIGHGGKPIALMYPRSMTFANKNKDIHTRNVTLAISHIHSMSEQEFMGALGILKTGEVVHKDGLPLESHVPSYQVYSSTYSKGLIVDALRIPVVKIVDFGESFLCTQAPATLHTPLALRAPEVLFGDKIDHRADLWSLGCLVL